MPDHLSGGLVHETNTVLGSEDCARCEVARPYFRRGEKLGLAGQTRLNPDYRMQVYVSRRWSPQRDVAQSRSRAPERSRKDGGKRTHTERCRN